MPRLLGQPPWRHGGDADGGGVRRGPVCFARIFATFFCIFCSGCDSCWTDPASQDQASACFQEKEGSADCEACKNADWSDMEGAEATCEPCWPAAPQQPVEHKVHAVKYLLKFA